MLYGFGILEDTPNGVLAEAASLRPFNMTLLGRHWCDADLPARPVTQTERRKWGEILIETRNACKLWPDTSGMRSLQLPAYVLSNLLAFVASTASMWHSVVRVALLVEISAVAWSILERALRIPALVDGQRPKATLAPSYIAWYLRPYRCVQTLAEVLSTMSLHHASGPCSSFATTEIETLFLAPFEYLKGILYAINPAAWMSSSSWPWWRRANFTGEMADIAIRDYISFRALDLVANCLSRCTRILEWWPIDGTLVGLLRYGSLRGNLSEGKIDVVDRDLEFMIGVKNQLDWEAVHAELLSSLEDEAAPDALQCHVIIGGYSGRHPRADHFWEDEIECWLCNSGIVPTLDYARRLRECILFTITRYFVDEAKGVAVLQYECSIAGPQGDRIDTRPDKPTEATECSVVRDLAPFQAWDGELPLSYLRPFGKCRAPSELTIPCPSQAGQLLLLLNKGEHDHSDTCLAVPFMTGERQADDERNWHLFEAGLYSDDLNLIFDYSERLSSDGFASFASILTDLNGPCSRSFQHGLVGLALPELSLQGPHDLFQLRGLRLRSDLWSFALKPYDEILWQHAVNSSLSWLGMPRSSDSIYIADLWNYMAPSSWFTQKLKKSHPGATVTAVFMIHLAVCTVRGGAREGAALFRTYCDEACVDLAHTNGYPLRNLHQIAETYFGGELEVTGA